MTTITTTPPTRPGPNTGGRLGKAEREMARAHARAEEFKRKYTHLRGLVLRLHGAVENGTGNWGDAEQELFKAVGK